MLRLLLWFFVKYSSSASGPNSTSCSLAVSVSPNFSGGTRVTATTGETFDNDPGVGGLGVSVDQASKITKNDAETYDDDPGVGGLGLLLGVGTVITRQNAETFDDDPGLTPIPLS